MTTPNIGDARESASVSQESGAMPFTSVRGLRVAFTGWMVPGDATFLQASLEHARLRRCVEEGGGVFSQSLTPETQLLVVGNSPGPKLERARENVAAGRATTRIVTVEQFRAWLETRS